MYLARTMPAGHNCPPQPSLRSSLRRRGGSRRPSKVVEVVVACLWTCDGTSDSLR